ncbi:class I adenylate-forming enzyme family protein [Oceanobacillus sp. CAU 1775]
MNWFESRVQLSPKKIAIIDSATNESWTYEELFERVKKTASYFQTKGIEKGDRVALLAPNQISYFDFFFAAMKLGAIFVPLNWRLATDELRYCVEDSNPKLIGVAPTFKENLDKTNTSAEVLIINDHNYIEDFYKNTNNLVKVSIKETDALAMIYTGGTTGKPKGVILSHRSILWNALNTIVSWGLQEDDTTLTCLPMFHTGGLNVLSLPLLLIGGKVVLSADTNPNQIIEDIQGYECTIVMLVPTIYHMLIEADTFQDATFPSVKLFLSGGAPCPYVIYEAFSTKGIDFKEGYGLTEAGPNNFYIEQEDVMRKRGSVGKPMLFNDIKIVAESGETLTKANEVGELYVRGNHAFMYYWNQPEETNKTLKDGWVRTGDLARQDAEGFVYIVGRKKDMIITGGENVYPLEIEHWLESHPAIDEVTVVGLPDDMWGEAVSAFVVTKQALSKEELENYCRKKLTSYKVPKQFYFLDELPKTVVGKVNKNKLKAIYSNHSDENITKFLG